MRNTAKINGVRCEGGFGETAGHVYQGIGMSLRSRSVHFFIGFGLVWLAHWIVLQRDPVLMRFVFADSFNLAYRIDIPNLDNAIFGAIVLLFGAFFLWRSFQGSGFASVTPTSPPFVANVAESQTGLRLLLNVIRANLPVTLIAVALYITLIVQLNAADRSGNLVFMWAITLVVMVYLGWVYDRRARISARPGIPRREWLILGAIVALSLVVNLHRLDSVPNNIIGDEGGFWDRALFISTGTDQTPFFDLGVYTYPIASSYFQAGIVKLLGASLWTWRFSSVIPGILALIPTYLLAREMFGRRTAIIAGLAMAIMPYFMAFNRMGYNNSQAILPVVLSMYFLWLGLNRESFFYVILSGVIAGLGYYTYTAGRLGLVIAAVFCGMLLLSKLVLLVRRSLGEARAVFRQQAARTLLLSVLFGISGLLTFLPNVVYGNATNPELLRAKLLESLFPNVKYALSLYTEQELYRDYPPIQVDTETFFYRPDLYYNLLVRGVVRTALAMHIYRGVTDSHFQYGPLAGPVAVLFYVVGLVFAFRHARRKEYLLLLIWFFSGLLLLSITNTFPPRHTHAVPIIPALAILVAVGIVVSVDLVRELLAALFRGKGAVAVSLLAAFIVVVIGVTNFRNYFEEMPPFYPADFDNYVGFSSIAQKSPQTIILVTLDPGQQQYMPWVVRVFPNKINWMVVTPDRLVKDDLQLNLSEDHLFFFREVDQQLVTSYLSRTFKREIVPNNYTDMDGRSIVLSWAYDSRTRATRGN